MNQKLLEAKELLQAQTIKYPETPKEVLLLKILEHLGYVSSLSQVELADLLGVTRQAISWREKRILLKLVNPLRKLKN